MAVLVFSFNRACGKNLRGGKVNIEKGDGTYNPKSAWMFVDSRRRVLPDIDGKI